MPRLLRKESESQGSGESSWAGRKTVGENRALGVGVSGSAGCSRVTTTNKGFARRPQRLLEVLYVAIPACGGEDGGMRYVDMEV